MRKVYALFIATMFVVMVSCGVEITSERDASDTTESRIVYNYARIGYPVKIHYFNRHQMNFMVVSTGQSNGGVTVVNLTIDSLQVELLKKQLNNN